MPWFRNPAAPEIGVGLALLVGGLAVAERGWSYSIGTISQIGPGFFPFWLGLLLALLSGIHLAAVVGAAQSMGGEVQKAEPFPWRPALTISGAMAAWIFLLQPLGLVPATAILVVLTSLSEAPLRPVTVLVSAIAIPAMTWLLFIYTLQMPLMAFAW